MIAFNRMKMMLKERWIRRGKFELLCAEGKIAGVPCKVVVLGAYIPPKTRADTAKKIMESIHTAIESAKQDYNDPILIVGGDFNRFDHDLALGDFPNVVLIPTDPTRGDKRLDLAWSNLEQWRTLTSVRDPLTTVDGTPNDHRIIYVENAIRSSHRFKKIWIRTRPKTRRGDTLFKKWIQEQDWQTVYTSKDANDKASGLVTLLNEAMNSCYPTVWKKIKTTEDPWIDDHIRKKIKNRKRTFKREDRSNAWKIEKKFTNDLIKAAKRRYYNNFVKSALKKKNAAQYYVDQPFSHQDDSGPVRHTTDL